MALIHDDEEILRKIIDQCIRRSACGQAGQVFCIVLDAGAVARLPHHFHVVFGAFLEALGFHEFVLAAEVPDAHFQIFLDLFRRLHEFFMFHDIVGGREEGHVGERAADVARQRIKFRDPVDLIAEEFHTDGMVSRLRREHFQNVAVRTEGAAFEFHLCAVILNVDERADHFVTVFLLSRAQRDHHVLIVHRASESVNAGDGSDDDHVAPFNQGHGRGKTKLVDLFVDIGVLFNIGVCLRNVSLRLIIIIIRHKILHGVFRKIFLHLAVELCRKGLVVGNDQGRFLKLLDDICHRKGLA